MIERMDDRLIIRNMVCDRCRSSVDRLLTALHIGHGTVQLGQVDLDRALDPEQRAALVEALAHQGFELVDDKRVKIIERIKTLMVVRVRTNALQDHRKEKLSVYLAREAGIEYSGLSKLFSSVEGLTLERYFNLLRIERAKELLVYDELSLTQIADQLGYSSVQHLSNQFSQHVGYSPSHFKLVGAERRKALDRVHERI